MACLHMRLAFIGVICLIASSPATASMSDQMALRQENQDIVIPDGTQIELRFAQDVWGQAVKKSALPVHVPGEVRPGDTVHLVSIADVRIGEHVVIAKGALAQATVVDVVAPIIYTGQPTSETGLFLRLDWLRSITGVEIPLRVFKKGGSGRFHVKVVPDGKATKVLPDKLTPLLSRMATSNEENEENSDKPFPSRRKRQPGDEPRNWIPVGTRITSFVQGAVLLNAAKVEQAQAQLPKMNSGAVLSIYRTQDHKSAHSVSCDNTESTQLGERQYVMLTLAAGQHSCQVDKEEPLVINVHAGDEMFAHLRPRAFGGEWALKLVSAAEGEAGIAAAEMVSMATRQ
jgi:hypothetical protein